MNSRGTVGAGLIAAVILAFVAWISWTRRQEDAALRSAALHTCTEALGDRATCTAAIARDHGACRTLATTYHGKGQGTTLSAGAYADCITRGPGAVRAERQAMRKAREKRQGDILR